MQDIILWTPFVFSLIVGLVSAAIVRKSLNQTMGIPTWDFSRSWASNISVVGGLVTLSALAFIPAKTETQLITRSAYAILLFVFPLLAALAPLIYNFSRHISKDTSNPPMIIAVGRAYMFIVASVFTMWASVGQLALQGLMLDELRRAGVLQSGFAELVELVLALIGLGLLFYGGKSVVETVRIQEDSTPSPARFANLSLGETHVQSWTLL